MMLKVQKQRSKAPVALNEFNWVFCTSRIFQILLKVKEALLKVKQRFI